MRDHFLGFTVHVHHKGGNSQQEMQKANALSQQQLNIMQSQLAMQANQLAMVNPTLQSIIGAGGMLPAQEAAMRTQALQGLGQQYQGLEGQIGQQLTARGLTGGQFAGGGAVAQGYGQLGALEAGQQSNLLNQIQLAKGQNLMGALQTGLGEAGMFGQQALGFGGQGVNALGIGAQAGQAADQAQTGFWGSLIGGLTGLGGNVALAACPAFGSSILMADGSQLNVETLSIGDKIMGIDGEPCTVEEIPSDYTKIIQVKFDDGHITRNSPTHAFVLARGGFTVSIKSLGKQVLTDGIRRIGTVVSIEKAGSDRVFNIITDGSHSYCADGVWALGVGDAERHIPMAEWAKIGAALNG